MPQVETRIPESGTIEVSVREGGRSRTIVITVPGCKMYQKKNGRPNLKQGDRVEIVLSGKEPLLIIPNTDGFPNDHFTVTRVRGPAGSRLDIHGGNVVVEGVSPEVTLERHGRPCRLMNGKLVEIPANRFPLRAV